MACTVRPGARGPTIGMVTAVAVLAMGLAACSSVTSLGNKIEDALPASVGGLPSDVPARPATQPDFVPVGDTPPRRDLKTLTEEERKKLQADLVTLRDQQEGKTSRAKEQEGKASRPKEQEGKTSRPKEKQTPSTSASAKVTDEAANR
jgi:hypothetical protein